MAPLLGAPGLMSPTFRRLCRPLRRAPRSVAGGPAREIVTTHSRQCVRLVVGGDVDFGVVKGQDTRVVARTSHLYEKPSI